MIDMDIIQVGDRVKIKRSFSNDRLGDDRWDIITSKKTIPSSATGYIFKTKLMSGHVWSGSAFEGHDPKDFLPEDLFKIKV